MRPTIKKIKTEAGDQWQITYAGMTRTVSDRWQAEVYLHIANEMYAESEELDQEAICREDSDSAMPPEPKRQGQ